jgi:hypothetical protein
VRRKKVFFFEKKQQDFCLFGFGLVAQKFSGSFLQERTAFLKGRCSPAVAPESA